MSSHTKSEIIKIEKQIHTCERTTYSTNVIKYIWQLGSNTNAKYKAISFLLAQAFVVFIGIFVLCKKQNITTKKLNEAAFKNSAINNAGRTTRGKEKKQRATSECEFCSVCLNFAKQKQHNKCAFKQKVILRQFKKELHLK